MFSMTSDTKDLHLSRSLSNWDLLLFAGLPHSSRFSVWTQRGHILVLNIWRQMCEHRSEQTCSLPQVLSSQTCWGVKQCEFTHQFLRSLLLFIDLSDRSIGFVSRSSLDGGAEDNPVSDWLNPGVAPGEWLTFMGLTVAALLSLNASLFATQTKVG